MSRKDESTAKQIAGGKCEVYFAEPPEDLRDSEFYLTLQTGITLSASSATFATSGSTTYDDIPYDTATYKYPVLKNTTKGEIVLGKTVGASGATFDIEFFARGSFFDKKKARTQRETQGTYAVAWETTDEIQIVGYFYDPRQATHPVNVEGDVSFTVSPETTTRMTNSSGPIRTIRTSKSYEISLNYPNDALPYRILKLLIKDDAFVYDGIDDGLSDSQKHYQWADDPAQQDVMQDVSLVIIPQEKIGNTDSNGRQKLEDCIWIFKAGLDGNKSFEFTDEQQNIPLTGNANFSEVFECAYVRDPLGFSA